MDNKTYLLLLLNKIAITLNPIIKIIKKKKDIFTQNIKKKYPTVYNFCSKYYIKLNNRLKLKEKEIKERFWLIVNHLNSRKEEFKLEVIHTFIIGFWLAIMIFIWYHAYPTVDVDVETQSWPVIDFKKMFPDRYCPPMFTYDPLKWRGTFKFTVPWIFNDLISIHLCPIEAIVPGGGHHYHNVSVYKKILYY